MPEYPQHAASGISPRAHPHTDLTPKELKKLCDDNRGGATAATPAWVVYFFLYLGAMCILGACLAF